MPLPRGQENATLLKALRSIGGDPKLSIRVFDHVDDHFPRAQVQPELDGNEHDGEQNSDKSDDQTNPIVKQISDSQR